MRRAAEDEVAAFSLRHRGKDRAYRNEVDLSFTWRKKSMHVARTGT